LNWFDAEAQAHRDIQAEFGEPGGFVTIPMTVRPNFPPAPDPTRPILELQGVFEWTAQMIGVGLDQVKVSSRNPTFTYMRCDLPYALRRADRLQRCSDASLFEVTNVEPDGVSGAVAELVQLGRQS
jgi:hypothetical protein